MGNHQSWQDAVAHTIDAVRDIIDAEGVTRPGLARVAGRLEELAAQAALFPASQFPHPANDDPQASARYLLHVDEDQRFALYLNSINPGKNSPPHDHKTWAAIAAVEGEELNRVYERTDDGSDPAGAQLRLAREVTVQPGVSIAFMPDDIHSIHVLGSRPTRHLHLYGRALETLEDRQAYDLKTGQISNYNRNFMHPTRRP